MDVLEGHNLRHTVVKRGRDLARSGSGEPEKEIATLSISNDEDSQ